LLNRSSLLLVRGLYELEAVGISFMGGRFLAGSRTAPRCRYRSDHFAADVSVVEPVDSPHHKARRGSLLFTFQRLELDQTCGVVDRDVSRCLNLASGAD
jgi:hypothetical protein